MNFSEVVNYYIPGYSFQPAQVRKAFKDSNAGRLLINAVKLTTKNLQEIDSGQIVNWFVDSSQRIIKLKDQILRRDKESFIKNIKMDINANYDYQQFTTKIIVTILESEYLDFNLLNDTEKTLLAKTAFSRDLQEPIYALNQAINNQATTPFSGPKHLTTVRELEAAEINSLRYTKERLVEDWRCCFFEDRKLIPLRDSIMREKRLLYEKKTKLALTLKASLHQVTSPYFSIINFSNFNLEQLSQINQTLLTVVTNKKNLITTDWLKSYKNNLITYIKDSLFLINGKKWSFENTCSLQEQLKDSLSALWFSKAFTKVCDFLNKHADAYAFIQATNFSTQNESSLLVIVDLYNARRLSDQIHVSKTIFSSLMSPFRPIYEEYWGIGLHERNLLRKVVRTIMPMLVIIAVTMLITSWLAAFVIPEIVFVITLVPVLFVALVAATFYVVLKNYLYSRLRQSYYGGAFEIPEFQVNTRMLKAFKYEIATKVRDFYINTLKHCDSLEASYAMKAKDNMLCQADLENRKQNIIDRQIFYLEWFDIHSNGELGLDMLSQLVQKRLMQVANSNIKNLEKYVSGDGNAQIKDFVEQLAEETKVKVALANPELGTCSIISSMKSRYTPLLFSALPCLKYKIEVENAAGLYNVMKVN